MTQQFVERLSDIMQLQQSKMPFALFAIADELGHLLTTAILLLSIRSMISKQFAAVALLTTVLIDLDHLPLYLRSIEEATASPRPVTHSFAPAVIALGIACVTPRAWRFPWIAVAFGIIAHLVRDVATGGARILWPLSNEVYELPFSVYMTSLLVAMLVSVAQEAARWTRGYLMRLDERDH